MASNVGVPCEYFNFGASCGVLHPLERCTVPTSGGPCTAPDSHWQRGEQE